jgi:predicted ester cyclase
MTSEDLVRHFTEEFKNRSNFAIVYELFAEDFAHHLPIPGIPPGRDGMKALGQFVTGAIRDIKVGIDILVADGDFVANRNSARGIRVDNGQEITWNEHEFWRVDNGRLAEQWSVASGLDIGLPLDCPTVARAARMRLNGVWKRGEMTGINRPIGT